MKLSATRHRTAKSLALAAAAVALLAMPAQAQMGAHKRNDDSKKADAPKKVDEKAYKAALERIPEPKEKYDPWGVTKPADAAKPADPAKKPKTP